MSFHSSFLHAGYYFGLVFPDIKSLERALHNLVGVAFGE
jgi:hypothetical protein